MCRAPQRTAHNELDFGGRPDRDGRVVAGEPVDPAAGPLGATRATSLKDLQRACEALRALGYAAEVSDDPGRYLCNALYFQALGLAAEHGTRALFLHVPPFEAEGRFGAAAQLAFLRDCARCLLDFSCESTSDPGCCVEPE